MARSGLPGNTHCNGGAMFSARAGMLRALDSRELQAVKWAAKPTKHLVYTLLWGR
jgi:hypothetical protein